MLERTQHTQHTQAWCVKLTADLNTNTKCDKRSGQWESIDCSLQAAPMMTGEVRGTLLWPCDDTGLTQTERLELQGDRHRGTWSREHCSSTLNQGDLGP